MRTVILYTRQGCHLCHEARVIIERAGRSLPLQLQEIDIDSEPVLRERYTERVPVALIGERELDWPFTERDVRAALG